jgi:hypothetical protein
MLVMDVAIVIGLGRLPGRTVDVIANSPLRKGGCLDSLSARRRSASSGCATRPKGGILPRRRLCRAASCRSARNGSTGEGSGGADGGRFLCMACQDRLVNNLLSLPALYSDCDRGASAKVVRAIRKVPRKSATTDSMNPAAAEIRSAILTVLASWAGLVAVERRLEPPARDLPALARFLCGHVGWLTRHPAAGDMADEVQDLTRAARNIAYSNSIRQVHIGYCPDGDCDGDLVALIRPHGDLPSEIICTISPGHSWPVTWWTKLARQMRGQGGST